MYSLRITVSSSDILMEENCFPRLLSVLRFTPYSRYGCGYKIIGTGKNAFLCNTQTARYNSRAGFAFRLIPGKGEMIPGIYLILLFLLFRLRFLQALPKLFAQPAHSCQEAFFRNFFYFCQLFCRKSGIMIHVK